MQTERQANCALILTNVHDENHNNSVRHRIVTHNNYMAHRPYQDANPNIRVEGTARSPNMRSPCKPISSETVSHLRLGEAATMLLHNDRASKTNPDSTHLIRYSLL